MDGKDGGAREIDCESAGEDFASGELEDDDEDEEQPVVFDGPKDKAGNEWLDAWPHNHIVTNSVS
ncbi:hypothetical protein A2783_02340 [Microgenomates group bacterium RIFCSPHIGHO2_01_FULL_45_11]|nr:MAG: hypothetical protein A2783_02340 [Microgenomates group bacterium RIFCSPHIGHO2_01_FULL_45_11]